MIDTDRPGRANFIFEMDVNRDGLTDIITGKFWYENPGTISGTWSRYGIGAPLEDAIAMYDFDGDGDQDLFGTAGATIPPEDSNWFPMVWARNDGAADFTILDNIADDLVLANDDPVESAVISRFVEGGPVEVVVTWDDSRHPIATTPGSRCSQFLPIHQRKIGRGARFPIFPWGRYVGCRLGWGQRH